MKKLMKAIAFATVMCMLLSTAAFAAVADGTTASLVENQEKILNVTIAGVGNGEQVSLLVVAPGTTTPDSSNIYYINQAPAASGQVTFNNINLTNVVGETVEVWAGNATYADANPTAPIQKLADVEITRGVTDVVIEVVECDFVDAGQSAAEDYTGAGVYATVNFTAVPEGFSLSKMVWAIETADKGFVYTPAIDLEQLGYGAIEAESGIQFAAAINNGSVKNEISTETVTSVDAIFLFVNNAGDQKEAYSNSDNMQTHINAKK